MLVPLVIGSLLYSLKFPQLCPLQLSLSLLEKSFPLFLLLHGIFKKVSEVLFFSFLFFLLIVKQHLGLIKLWFFDHFLQLLDLFLSFFLFFFVDKILVVDFVCLLSDYWILELLNINETLLILYWTVNLDPIDRFLDVLLKLNGPLLVLYLWG